ncbi:acyl-CoA dehydrogenase family protein [Kitasatospora terrestris]|uniref:Acyl-CoA dehydrogenase/oxidase C-terminal domain-containing protein n=1 Tax=Kitasatospora terrestris TaxID=258051 RepID=A0ABP9DCM5_9ACTN
MNLLLDPAQHGLLAAVEQSGTAAGPGASGWEVVDGLGLSELLLPEPGRAPLLGLLEWCLVLEELGAGCRDHALVRQVRALLDTLTAGPADPRAGEEFLRWARARRADADPREELPAALARTTAAADPRTARDVADRDLIALGAYAVGVGRRCLELAQQRASRRVVAGRRLLEHQGTSHRIARCAVDLVLARAGLWRAAQGEDQGERAAHRAPAAAAASLSAALDCAHTAVQVFGAAGTSDPDVVRLFRTAYSLGSVAGSARVLWQSAGTRRLQSPF